MNLADELLNGSKNWRENTFVFTLDANDEAGACGDNYLNCMCMMFNDLMRRNTDGSIFIV
jgi:hypothetical protein